MAAEPSKEARILRIMKRVLTDVAKETFTKPGFRHPLSDETIQNMREALMLITAREAELADAPSRARPRYADERAESGPAVVDISGLTRTKPREDDD
ncbi:segregation and condensation protein A [Ectothiorhodospiraceae bacterium 2226]|nr:segregation and condensation protein A [Ectothiorhodospiraceae bacterium 2226]